MMATELVWYEVIDLTSYGMKYPKDWFYRCGHKQKCWDNSVCESLGQYSCKAKAIARLYKWANDKGLDAQKSINYDESYPSYYENDLSITCYCLMELGKWYDINDNLTTKREDQVYGIAAMVVKKVLELDRD